MHAHIHTDFEAEIPGHFHFQQQQASQQQNHHNNSQESGQLYRPAQQADDNRCPDHDGGMVVNKCLCVCVCVCVRVRV